MHDSRYSSELVDCNDIKREEFYMDSGYVGMEIAFVRKGMKARICERGCRGHLLTEEQQESIASLEQIVKYHRERRNPG